MQKEAASKQGKTFTKDIVGQKFGKLTVIERAGYYVSPKGDRKIQWSCNCDCGKEKVIIVGASLKNGLTKSCGCLVNNNQIPRRKNYINKKINEKSKNINTYNLYGDYGIGYAFNNNKEFYFDIEDYDKIKDYCWSSKDRGYISSFTTGKVFKLLHRLIMNCPTDYEVDHINHKTWDNRKLNLRIVSKSNNLQNQRLSDNNTSGYTGVCWDKTKEKWIAYIKVYKKAIHLGRYINKEDAVKARKEAEELYFGEYSYDNSISRENIELLEKEG
jgi:hypothetical protein